MSPHYSTRPTGLVSAAARSTNSIEPAQSAIRAIRSSGARSLTPGRLQINDSELQRHVQLQVSKFGSQIAHAVNIDVRLGEVRLSGVVGSDYERRLVEQSVGRLAGIVLLSNEIGVRDHRPVQRVAFGDATGLRKLTWKIAAITGVLVVVAASLLLVFQVANAAAEGGRAGIAAVVNDGRAESSPRTVSRDVATECCLSLELRR